MNKFYKVFCNYYGDLRSSAGNLQYRYVITYEKDVINYPIPGSKLFIFSTLESATLFREGFFDVDTYEIWEVEVENPQPCPVIGNAYIADKFWEKYAENKIATERIVNDYGTEFVDVDMTVYKATRQYENTWWCDSLKLVQRVDV